MKTVLAEERFHILSAENKAFIMAFDEKIAALGYGFGGKIGSGFCWGKYMIIYSKSGVKSKRVVARIYIGDNYIVLRLFLHNIDKHRAYLEAAPGFITEVFSGEYGNCRRCHNDKDGACRFRKTYTLHDNLIEKCNGLTFEFWRPDLEKLPGYIGLLAEFYPKRKRKTVQ